MGQTGVSYGVDFKVYPFLTVIDAKFHKIVFIKNYYFVNLSLDFFIPIKFVFQSTNFTTSLQNFSLVSSLCDQSQIFAGKKVFRNKKKNFPIFPLLVPSLQFNFFENVNFNFDLKSFGSTRILGLDFNTNL